MHITIAAAFAALSAFALAYFIRRLQARKPLVFAGSPSVSLTRAEPLMSQFHAAEGSTGTELAGAYSDGMPMGWLPSVSVVVPALNEEECVGWVIDNIPDWVSEVVLVDGLSVDGTELVAVDRRSDVVIVHQRERGKGAALRAGFAAASGDVVVMIDADGSTDPREMGRFVEALMAGSDFVKGSRNLAGGGSVDFTLLRDLGNRGFVAAANVLFGSRFTDLCYGYCAFWSRHLDTLALTADGFEIEMELVLSAVKAGLEITEVPSIELQRRAGVSNLNAWADGKRVLKTLVRERFRRLDTRQQAAVPVTLRAAYVAAHETPQWVPAGQDRRRGQDRRVSTTPYNGPERRAASRRTPITHTTPILLAEPAGTANRHAGEPIRQVAQVTSDGEPVSDPESVPAA
jgi:hypothetical protein